ncbi:MAG TPA: DMT family transporter [Methylocystis sp.]|nr:DMT family transporter [Methylocystis sp.]
MKLAAKLNHDALGFLFAMLGAILFSTKSVVVKLAYGTQVSPEALLVLRLLFALPFYVFVAIRSNRNAPALAPFDGLKIACLGVIGYYVASILDFEGLARISAGLERLILYTYPVIVILLSAAAFGRSITVGSLMAFGVVYFGVALVVFDGHAKMSLSPDWMVGGVLVLLSAAAYAIYLVGSQSIIKRLGSARYTACAMPAAAFGALLHFLLADSAHQLLEQSAAVYGYALFLATFSTVLPSFLTSEGLARIGAANTAMIGAAGPVATMLMAWLALDEAITAQQLIGAALVLYGVGATARAS